MIWIKRSSKDVKEGEGRKGGISGEELDGEKFAEVRCQGGGRCQIISIESGTENGGTTLTSRSIHSNESQIFLCLIQKLYPHDSEKKLASQR